MTGPPQDSGGGDLGFRFHRGLTLSVVNTVVSRAGVFLLGILLARLLVPAEFGLYATALVVQTMFQALNEVGAGAAIVRRQGDVRSILPTAWTLSVAWGLAAFVLLTLLAPALAAGLGSPGATGLIRFMAVSLAVEGFAAVPAGLLTRHLLQSRRLVADVAGMATNVVTTATLALRGHGAWSLAVGYVAGMVVVVVLLTVLARSWPRFGWSRADAGGIAATGTAVAGSSLLFVALQLGPQVVTGTVLGTTALGYFYLASNVANWPSSMVSTTLERVGLATFSRVREAGTDLSEVAGTVLAMVGGATLAGGLGLALLARDVVTVVYGTTWLPSVAVMATLAIAGVARSFAELVVSVLVASGATANAVIPQVVWLAVLVPVTTGGAALGGLAGVGWGQLVVAGVVAVPLYLWFAARRGGIRLAPLGRHARRPLLVVAVAGATTVAVREASPWPALSLTVGALVTIGAVGVVYLIMRSAVTASMTSTVRASPPRSGEPRNG